MPSVAVLIPFAGTCPHRTAALNHVLSWYRRNLPTSSSLRIGYSSEGEKWCKAEAVGNTLHKLNSDILVIADADCIAPRLSDAIDAVTSGAPWAMPHHVVHRLSQNATRLVLDGAEPSSLPRESAFYDQMPYAGYAGGGITVVTRDVYKNCPLDPRFLGWGQEDESWARALTILYGKPWRDHRSHLFHLWHPPQRRLNRSTGSETSRRLFQQYRFATTRAAMEEQLAEARHYIEPLTKDWAQYEKQSA